MFKQELITAISEFAGVIVNSFNPDGTSKFSESDYVELYRIAKKFEYSTPEGFVLEYQEEFELFGVYYHSNYIWYKGWAVPKYNWRRNQIYEDSFISRK